MSLEGQHRDQKSLRTITGLHAQWNELAKDCDPYRASDINDNIEHPIRVDSCNSWQNNSRGETFQIGDQ